MEGLGFSSLLMALSMPEGELWVMMPRGALDPHQYPTDGVTSSQFPPTPM